MSSARYDRPAYRAYVLAALTGGCALNFLDRQLVVILQEPIKAELGLSDTELGLLSGVVFAALYVVSGLFVAHWSETRARRDIVALAIGVWSLMTAACGIAQNFLQLLLARGAVAIGESGGGPPSHSMISDIYAPEHRGTALAVYSSGINIGVLAGFLLGGWINEFLGWRAAFLCLGIPGVFAALLLRLSVVEPQRGRFDAAGAPPRTRSLVQGARALLGIAAFRWLALAAAFQAFGLYGVGSWFPSYLIRTFGLGTGEVGTWLALTVGGVGAFGTIAGGAAADRLARRDRRWYVWLPLACSILSAPFVVAMLLVERPGLAIVLNAAPVLLNFVYLGPVLALTHSLVGAHMRATASAVLFFVINLIGLGLGPLFVGVMSDALRASLGADSMRAALLATVALSIGGATLLYTAAARELRRAGVAS